VRGMLPAAPPTAAAAGPSRKYLALCPQAPCACSTTAAAPLSLARHVGCSVLHLAQARQPGERVVAGQTQAMRRRNWPLPGYATILGCQMSETGRPLLRAAFYGIRTKNACCKPMFQVFQMFDRYVASVFI
jgi:hypothetical protein